MTNADAIRKLNDEELAKMLSTVSIDIARDVAKGVSEKVLNLLGLPAQAELLNEIIDKSCKMDDSFFEWMLRFLQREYIQTMSSG